MACLDDRPQQARNANAVAAHLDRNAAAVGGDDGGAHRLGILGAEVKDLPNLDTTRHFATLFRDRVEQRLVVGLVSAGVKRGEFLADLRDLLAVVVIHVALAEFQIGYCRIEKHLGLAGRGQHEEFMRVVAANRARGRAHRDCRQAHTFIGPQIADHVAVVGVQRGIAVHVEGIAVLHQELAPAHHTKARTHLVAEFPLDVIKRQRQLLVAFHVRAEDVGDHLFVGRAIQHLALMAVRDAQHFFAVVVITPRLAPQIGRLQRGHQQRNVPRACLLFVHDGLDPLQHSIA
ncbi:hypothetical protein GALL_414110 [mine drainage metagenome]|uniref:Uncharacterized protein n=1 Tax=mine drainage metagenome TaxID=410659 RepID=A0A1J5Q0W2_9ZZZZ